MKNNQPRSRGRPRKFDKNSALDQALETFWAQGFTATSLDDLTEAMGINRPSLYATFGNKHDLFIQSIRRYGETIGNLPLQAFLEEPDIRRAIDAYFQATIRCVTSQHHPRGCLIMNVAGEHAANDPAVRTLMNEAYRERIDAVSDRLRTARDAGGLPNDTDPDDLARMITAVMHSLAARARAGADRKELSRLARNFLDLLIPAKASDG